MQLKTLLSDQQRQDTEILAVAPEGRDDLLRMIERITEEDGIPSKLVFLSDPDLRVIARYGLFNPDGAGNGRYQVPHPATYVIDREGTVRWRSVDVDYSSRPSNADLAAVLDPFSKNLLIKNKRIFYNQNMSESLVITIKIIALQQYSVRSATKM